MITTSYNELKDWTVSNLFIVPLLRIGRGRLEGLGFINSYLINGEEPDEVYPDTCIHLLFCPKYIEKFNDFILAQKESENQIIQERDYPGGFILITYKLPSKFDRDYQFIWEGKYSKVSEEFQRMVPSVVRYTREDGVTTSDMTLQHMVFKKYAPLRRNWEAEFNVQMDDEQELWTKPTIESETFKLVNHECVTDSIEDSGDIIV